MLRDWARLLRAESLYRRLRASALYEIYLKIFRRDLLRDRQDEVDFYRSTLEGFTPGDSIIDVGANEGHKTEVFRSMGARVVAVEPDRTNAAHLRGRFKSHPTVVVVPRAASSEPGWQTFNVFEEGSALNTLSDKWVDTLGDAEQSRFGSEMKTSDSYEVETTTLEEIVEHFGPAFYIKIDVEGHEVEAIQGLKRAPRYLSFELNLPEFLDEGLRCIELLTGIDESVRFNHVTGMRLESDTWVGATEFAAWLASTENRYMEVYARFPKTAAETGHATGRATA